MNWTDFYMGLAFVVSQKSPDEETKHGCVITDRMNRVLGVGFNGFPRGIYDKDLPRTRPDKYIWFDGAHSELNALLNCRQRDDDMIAYVTGKCCHRCLTQLWQGNVKTVYMADRKGSQLITEEHEDWEKEFIKRTGMKVEVVQPKLDWLEGLMINLDLLGFLDTI